MSRFALVQPENLKWILHMLENAPHSNTSEYLHEQITIQTEKDKHFWKLRLTFKHLRRFVVYRKSWLISYRWASTSYDFLPYSLSFVALKSLIFYLHCSICASICFVCSPSFVPDNYLINFWISAVFIEMTRYLFSSISRFISNCFCFFSSSAAWAAICSSVGSVGF